MSFLEKRNIDHRFAPLGPGERVLGRFVLPPFQRPAVWTQEQQIKFIESCWMGLPIGAFVYNQTPDYESPYDCWLLDGQQRVRTVLMYMDDEFPVMGYLFSELTQADHRRWSMSTSFPCLKTCLESEEELKEVYMRLAYGGTPHEPLSE